MQQGALPPEIKRPETVKVELSLFDVDVIQAALEDSDSLSAKLVKQLVGKIAQQTMEQVMAYHNAQSQVTDVTPKEPAETQEQPQ